MVRKLLGTRWAELDDSCHDRLNWLKSTLVLRVMAISTHRDQIRLAIIPGSTAKLLVMDLKPV